MKLSLDQLDALVFDFDGVLTDNKVNIDQFGNESVQVNRSDGLGISKIKELGIEQIILSTETNVVVLKRAEKLGLKCIQSVKNKAKELSNYCLKKDISLQRTVYLGNDINDKKAMDLVGYPICPSDAHESIKSISKIILFSKGGEGVARELIDLLVNRKRG